MKKLLTFAMLFVLAFFSAMGQSKKSTPIKPSGKYAVIQLPAHNEIKNIAEGSNFIYLNTGKNVYSVDKVSGEVKVILSSNDNTPSLYGRDIKAIAAHGTTLYYWVGGKGLFIQGTEDKPTFSADEDRITPKYMSIDPSGDFMLIYGRGSNAICLSLRTKKPSPYIGGSASCAEMSGNHIYTLPTSGKVNQITMGKDTLDLTSKSKPYVTIYQPGTKPERFTEPVFARVSWIEKGTTQYDDVNFITSDTKGNIYVGMEEKIYTLPGWIEVFSTEDKDMQVVNFVIRDNKAFAHVSGDFKTPFWEFSPFSKDSRLIQKNKELQTDILEPKLWPGDSDRYFKNNQNGEMYIDNDGNLWKVGEYSTIFIYNSDGIKGLRNLKGNYVKVEDSQK